MQSGSLQIREAFQMSENKAPGNCEKRDNVVVNFYQTKHIYVCAILANSEKQSLKIVTSFPLSIIGAVSIASGVTKIGMTYE